MFASAAGETSRAGDPDLRGEINQGFRRGAANFPIADHKSGGVELHLRSCEGLGLAN